MTVTALFVPLFVTARDVLVITLGKDGRLVMPSFSQEVAEHCDHAGVAGADHLPGACDGDHEEGDYQDGLEVDRIWISRMLQQVDPAV
jgi:hypothetical protein